MTTDLLDVQGVAKLLGWQQSTVRAAKSRGLMPPPDIQLGRSPGWYRETIERWMQGEKR